MEVNGPKEISGFYIAGINYRKADADIRGKFAVNQEQYAVLLEQAPSFGVTEFFIVSTCNRSEIYGFAEKPGKLGELLCSQTQGSLEVFNQLGYVKQGYDAIEHLFHVGAGLDSQILGDYEIIGQIKQAAKFAKQYDRIGAFTERLLNCMLQASKAIKNNTALSDGTVSVSFAAVQFIKETITNPSSKQFLLLGTGKIGRNTCKNLIDYLGTKNITLINRTDEKASQLANELGLQSAPLKSLQQYISASDIILVATSSEVPVIMASQIAGTGAKLIIDLSMPHNVDPESKNVRDIKLVNVDELSKLKDETLSRRQREVPKAIAIIAEHIKEFSEWYQMRKHVPVLKAVKTKLREIQESPLFIPLYGHPGHPSNGEEKIQRVINGMATKMKIQNLKGCHYIEAINEFIATGTN